MNNRRLSGAAPVALALAAGLTLAACNSDRAGVTGPGSALHASAAVAQTAPLAPVLKRNAPLAHDVSASITVGRNGGVLRLPEAGLQVVIPRNALPSATPLTITVTAVAGDAVAYQFEPHGVVFAAPLLATQDLKPTTWSANTGRQTLEAAYFATPQDLDVAAGTARLSEFFASTFVATGKSLRWGIPHFSGYVIVTGRGPVNNPSNNSGDNDNQ